VLCITGNGLKTTDVLAGVYEMERPIAPKLAEFENYLQQSVNVAEVGGEAARAVGV
jgi:threonine synthase